VPATTSIHRLPARLLRRVPEDRLAIALRGIVVAGVAVTAADHFLLWRQGYDAVAVIGPLFLVASVLGLLLGVGVATGPRPALVVAAMVFAAGALAAYSYSLMAPLFGFMEPFISRGGEIAIGAEGAVIVAGLAWSWRPFLSRRSATPSGPTDPATRSPTSRPDAAPSGPGRLTSIPGEAGRGTSNRPRPARRGR